MGLLVVRFLIVGFFAVLAYAERPEDSGVENDIYPYVIEALRELKVRQLAENVGIQNAAAPGGSVCYDDLGCFDRNGTFKHLKQLPDTPENIATMFLLYRQSHSLKPQILDYKKPETVLNSNLDPRLPVKFITHGFGGRNNLTWIVNMKNEFLAKDDMNVIVIDWSKGAAAPHYINAVVNTELVGAQAAVLFLFMKDKMQFSEKNLHVIGFSLGAHVSGFIGKRLQSLRGIRPARITGLDPASPLFEDYGEDVHIYKDDGDFVDVVHTNADLLIYGGVGIGAAIGHVDYYPNGGIRQPGCASTLTGVFKDLMMKGLRHRACNHERAALLFTESIRSENCFFHSYACEDFKKFSNAMCFNCKEISCGMMGFKNKGSGTHYFLTKGTKPYCAENVKTTVKLSKHNKKSYGEIIVFFLGANDIKENVSLTKKDEKLVAGTVLTVLAPVDAAMRPLKEIQVLYKKYNGWISSGTPNYNISSVLVQDGHGKTLFNSCNEQKMEDAVIQKVKPTEKSC